MRKVITSINITLDGFCDHTAVIADQELHQDANDLFVDADILILGRITYELMRSGWAPIVQKPTGQKAMDEFAVLIENIDKVVFSRSLKTAGWKNARIKNSDLQEEVTKLKKQDGRNIFVGGPSLIIQLMNLDLIDEYRFCVQPIILGSGMPLFKNIKDRINLRLTGTKVLGSGAVTLIYERNNN
ncbi:MAG: dihydrofolate reductase [Chitinophagaceae bacterium]|nr:MAG: dihydrofolate reductase [Chitinophagaceae bacterium]